MSGYPDGFKQWEQRMFDPEGGWADNLIDDPADAWRTEGEVPKWLLIGAAVVMLILPMLTEVGR